ncbi:MAG: ABC transporter ATP-binding protein [Clostridia bacterium]|nr:ABC transporter ATP-binding protein [Clostridia bacterium]
MLKVTNANVFYGKIHAIKDVSFEVNDGEVVALIGANGAGKSTILRTVSGLLRSRTGIIAFDGKNIGTMPAHKIVNMGLAQVPEGRRIFLQMTVMENLEMIFSHFPRLKERVKQLAGTLSGGEQQMLAMGRALMSHPRLLMMDEPSMGLSPILVQEIFNIIQEINKEGTTVLLVEQNAHMALSIASRAYVLETGNIIKEGNAADLLRDDDVRKAYLGN